jgi:hypothetical protein
VDERKGPEVGQRAKSGQGGWRDQKAGAARSDVVTSHMQCDLSLSTVRRVWCREGGDKSHFMWTGSPWLL